jgi:hypothetical protein
MTPEHPRTHTSLDDANPMTTASPTSESSHRIHRGSRTHDCSHKNQQPEPTIESHEQRWTRIGNFLFEGSKNKIRRRRHNGDGRNQSPQKAKGAYLHPLPRHRRKQQGNKDQKLQSARMVMNKQKL